MEQIGVATGLFMFPLSSVSSLCPYNETFRNRSFVTQLRKYCKIILVLKHPMFPSRPSRPYVAKREDSVITSDWCNN